jgi:SSS family solute:Na+ symporter
MESMLSGIFLALTSVAYILVAWLASRGVSSKESYLLGNRSFNAFSITLTLIATQLGAGMIFGTAAESYHKGFAGLAYILGMALGLIILGLGVGARLRSLNISTTAELFETKYKSPALRKLAAIISILTMGGILAAQMVASKQLFSSLFDLSPWWLIAFWLVIIGYTMFGGIKAIIATDILQVFLIVAVFSVVLFMVIPVNEMKTALTVSADDSPFFADGFFAALVAPVLFSLIEQDLAQRFFAAKSQRVATISAFLAAGFLLIFAFVPMLLGIYAKLVGISFTSGLSPLVLLLQSKLPSFGMTVVACALLAAICSTADSLLGAASSNLIADFGNIAKRHVMLWSRLITFVVGVVALIIAFDFDNVIGVIVKSYEISISGLFVPLIIAMYAKNPSTTGAKLSVSAGFLTFILASLAKSSWSATLIALIISGFAFLAGTLWDKKKRD